MTTTRRNHLTSHDHSPFITERRRKLFPIEDHDMDSELGQIEPLCSDTSDSDNEASMISNYDIMELVENRKIPGNETPMSIKTYSDTMSPLKLSPCTNAYLRDTPRKYSPTHNLKTPHDTSTKPVLQKEQKVLLEESKSLKRKSSPNSSPEQNKSLKVDLKSSKVRTALFPPENEIIYASLPTKSFYSKNQDNTLEKREANRDRYVPKPIKFSIAKHSYKHKKKFGQINNGVRHSIRKPKQRKISVNSKATKKMLESGAAINEFLQDLAELKNRIGGGNKLIYNPLGDESKKEPINEIKTLVAQSPANIEEDSTLNGYMNDIKELETTKKLITNPIKQIKAFAEEDKENVQIDSSPRSVSPLAPCSPEGNNKSRKFFKSSRSKKDCMSEAVKEKSAKRVANKCDEVKNDAIKFILPVDESQSIANNVRLESGNDFEDEDIEESKADIDNILSVLTAESPQKNVGSGVNEVAGVQYPFHNAYQSNFDNLSQNVVFDNDQYSYDESASNQNYSYVSSNMENFGFIQESRINVCADQNQVGLAENLTSFDVNLPDNGGSFEQNTSEPEFVSSQVVFNDFLGEEPDGYDISQPKGPIQEDHTTSKIILEAHNSIAASENSIQLHRNDVANMILSPISQMCDVTSGLAINSPKKGRDLKRFLNVSSRASKILSFNTSCNNSSDMERQQQQQQQQKLFPIFTPGGAARGGTGTSERGEKRERGEVKRTTAKRFKALSQDQMLLDAGQKKFGYTICNECNIVYHMGDPGDEIQHMNYHNANHILRFAGWKNEHVVADFLKNGRIIRVLPTDSKIWLKKVTELMEFVKRELGCYEMEYDITGSQVYLYIKNRTIAGCAVATVPREAGHRMLTCVDNVAMCSEQSYPIRCGISHIWVAAAYRKQGVATSLMDAVKKNFIYGYVMKNDDVALTSPTEAGSGFAEKYFGTPNYLIYYV